MRDKKKDITSAIKAAAVALLCYAGLIGIFYFTIFPPTSNQAIVYDETAAIERDYVPDTEDGTSHEIQVVDRRSIDFVLQDDDDVSYGEERRMFTDDASSSDPYIGTTSTDVPSHSTDDDTEGDSRSDKENSAISNATQQEHPSVSQTPSRAPQSVVPQMRPRTIKYKEVQTSYIYSIGWVPKSGGGVWYGNDSVSDSKQCYFVGHNPGDFYWVTYLQNGDALSVCDSSGNTRSYSVCDVFIVNAGTYYETIMGRLNPERESIVLQTCINGGAQYRIVVAA